METLGFQGPMGSAVSTFIGYKQTEKQIDKKSIYKDYIIKAQIIIF